MSGEVGIDANINLQCIRSVATLIKTLSKAEVGLGTAESPSGVRQILLPDRLRGGIVAFLGLDSSHSENRLLLQFFIGNFSQHLLKFLHRSGALARIV